MGTFISPAALLTICLPVLLASGTNTSTSPSTRAAQASLAGANGLGPAFYEGKLATARFYFQRILPQSSGHFAAIMAGKGSTMALDPEAF